MRICSKDLVLEVDRTFLHIWSRPSKYKISFAYDARTVWYWDKHGHSKCEKVDQEIVDQQFQNL